VKFRRKVVPGDVLELHVKALRGGGRVWKFEGRAMVGGELACEATFMAMFDVPKA
jgi:3-hydroxyacyl-[acyl-carrier-protein] dehydratase